MKLIQLALCTSLAMIPLLANAGDLKIANRTKFDLSFRIHYVCSDSFGVISPDTIKIIAEKDFNKACEYNPAYCVATVYKKAHCKGENIADISFDTSYGVSSINGSGGHSEPISITANGFNLIFTSPLKNNI